MAGRGSAGCGCDGVHHGAQLKKHKNNNTIIWSACTRSCIGHRMIVVEDRGDNMVCQSSEKILTSGRVVNFAIVFHNIYLVVRIG